MTLRPAVTPLVRLEQLSTRLGVEVWVKREDLSHPDFGGNKVRKLAFILPAAAEAGATDLITAGALGSNHVAATVVHGRAAGFAVHALLVPQEGVVPRPVRELCLSLGAQVEETTRADLRARMGSLAEALRRQGRVPFLVPLGGSMPVALEGYSQAVAELAGQLTALGEPPPDVMAAALGTGGTVAGLARGVARLRMPAEVLAVRVVEEPLTRRESVERMAGGAPLTFDDGQVGPGYSQPTAEAAEAIALFAEDGVALEPVYTGKAAAGLIQHARRQRRARYLFWHTRPNR